VAGERAPRIGAGAITVNTDDPETRAPAAFPPESILHCRVDASDPEGDPLRIGLGFAPGRLRNPNTGGDREQPTRRSMGWCAPPRDSRRCFSCRPSPAPTAFSSMCGRPWQRATANYPLLVKARNYGPVPVEKDSARFGAGIQRTMTLLATSTPSSAIRCGCCSTPIAHQAGLDAGCDRVSAPAVPLRRLVTANRAIGGYSSQYLIQTLPHDVYAFYPDLICSTTSGRWSCMSRSSPRSCATPRRRS